MSSKNGLKLIINAIGFQVGWFLCVLYGNSAAIIVFPTILIIYISLYRKSNWDLLLISSIILLGFVGDSLLGIFNVLIFPSSAPLPPFWLVTLWLLFATTLPWSLNWIASKRITFIALATIFGTASYYAGVELTTIEFGYEQVSSIFLISLMWLFYGFLIQYIFNFWKRKCAKQY